MNNTISEIGDRVSLGESVTIGDNIVMSNNISENTHSSNSKLINHTGDYPWIFLTGAAGYIGSHLSAEIKSKTPYNLMQIDRRSKMLEYTTNYCDIFADEDFASPLILSSIQEYKPQTVIHLAASSSIGPGQTDPISYWENNVSKTIKLLDACVKAKVKNFIFASTSAIYSDDLEVDTVSETSPIIPFTAYARSKYAIELALQDCYHSHKMNSISFRFFNAAGAHHFYDLGPLYNGNHLLEKIMESLVHNEPLTVFGNDYPTNDGTAIRDYTHVLDIADAIDIGIEWLKINNGCHTFNLGSGLGHSVQEVINRTEQVLNTTVPYRYGNRRDGDSIKRVADISLAKEVLNWHPKRNIDDIIKDSFKWYKSPLYNNLYARKIWNEY